MAELTPEQLDKLVRTTNSRGAAFDPIYSYVSHIVGGSAQRHYWLYLVVHTPTGDAATTRKSPRDWLEDDKAYDALIDDCLDHIEAAIGH